MKYKFRIFVNKNQLRSKQEEFFSNWVQIGDRIIELILPSCTAGRGTSTHNWQAPVHLLNLLQLFLLDLNTLVPIIFWQCSIDVDHTCEGTTTFLAQAYYLRHHGIVLEISAIELVSTTPVFLHVLHKLMAKAA